MKTKTGKQWHKRYLKVEVEFGPDGRMLPKEIIWDSEHRYPIARVLQIVPRPAYGAGGQGDCYTIVIEQGVMAYERQLFFERSAALSGNEVGRWFVEAAPEQV